MFARLQTRGQVRLDVSREILRREPQQNLVAWFTWYWVLSDLFVDGSQGGGVASQVSPDPLAAAE